MGCNMCDGRGMCAVTPDAGRPPVQDAGQPMDAGPVFSYEGDGCVCSTQTTSTRKSAAGMIFAAVALASVRRRRRSV